VSIWVSVKIGWVEFELNNKFTVDATKTSFITLTLKPISNITSSQQTLISLKYCTGEIVSFYYWSFELWSSQCFHNHLVKNPFTISKIPFPQNFLATRTVEKVKKIQANLRQIYHRPYEKSSIITLLENLGKLSRVPSMNVSAQRICLCSSRGVRCLIMLEGLNGRRRWTANFEIYSP
jgi:hypothetical protein